MSCVTDNPEGCPWVEQWTWEENDCRGCCAPGECQQQSENEWSCDRCSVSLPGCFTLGSCYKRWNVQYELAPSPCPVCNLMCDCNDPPCMYVPNYCERIPDWETQCFGG